MSYKKLDSNFDVNEIYSIWEDIIRHSCYPSNIDISDKYFALLNEYYSIPDRTFSNWNLIHNALDFFVRLPPAKLDIKTKDLIMLGIFFSFIHFNALSCNHFEKSAYESLDALDRLGLSSNEIKFVFSHISSLDYSLIYDENKNYSYHAMRDSCFFWLYNNPVDYLEIVDKLKQEANATNTEWEKERTNFIISGLESECLMHTEGFEGASIHKLIQNNLLDELNILSKASKMSNVN